jgi:hypothetical protein
MKHNKNLIKSGKARVTGTIPYCHGKVLHSRKLISLCSNDFVLLLKSMDWWWKLFQGNSDILIDSCTYMYIQVLVRDITLECLQITPTKFRGSTFPGNMHNYIWCPYYIPCFMKFCSVVSEELRWQAASVVNFGKFLSSKGHNSHNIQAIKISW